MSLANVVRRHVTPTCIAEGKITQVYGNDLDSYFTFSSFILYISLHNSHILYGFPNNRHTQQCQML